MLVAALVTGLIFAVHVLIAAVTTRYFRVRLTTRWGSALYAVLFVPVLLVVSTIALTGGLGLGMDLGSPAVVLLLLVLIPLCLGAAIDVFYVRPPEEVDLPEERAG